MKSLPRVKLDGDSPGEQVVAIHPDLIKHYYVQTKFVLSTARFQMKTTYRLALLLASAFAQSTFASSIIPLSTAEHVAASAAVFRGVVVGQECYRDSADGLIYTRTSLRVVEPLKGVFPMIVAVVHRGGAIGEDREFQGNSPLFAQTDERLMFAVRRADGKLTGTQGSFSAMKLNRTNGSLPPEQESLLNEVRALTGNGTTPGDDLTDQVGFASSSLITGLLEDNPGISSRFIQCDRGEPIPVLIDASALPAGITLAQATNAVIQALNAWSAVTKLKFKIEAIQSFGVGANTIATSDEKLRIQLHDTYNSINSVGTLGIGGRGGLSSPLGTWDLGGAVGTNEFYKTAYGYVVLEHGAPTMQNMASFTEVLCHEVGHALSMAHSSENPSEPNTTLKQAIMYYQIHGDGRGASLGFYDPPVIQQAYPSNNTPPYSYSRVLDVTTDSPNQPNIAGINDVELRGYDMQSSGLALLTTNATVNNGAFTTVGSTVKFTADGFYNSGGRLDPAGGTFYDIIYARFSDGTNASPYATVKVLSLNPDSQPSPAGDGIPDAWMTTHFGNASPTVGLNHGAAQDADGDKLSNINEYRTGMTPTDSASAQRITLVNKTNIQFQAKSYELYELHASTNLTNWVRAVNPIVPLTSTGSFTGFTNTAPHMFFRVEKVR